MPIYHLDKYFWGPGWTHPDYEAYKIIHDELCDKDEWIIDGMNLRLAHYRLDRADIIIFLDFPLYLCFWRIFKRQLKYYGKETPSSAPGCPERLGWHFVQFLKWVWDFEKRYPERITWMLKIYGEGKLVYVFKSQKEVDNFLCAFGKNK